MVFDNMSQYRKLAVFSFAVVMFVGYVSGGWSVVKPKSDGKSGINADQLDGFDVEDIAGVQNLTEVLEQGNSAGTYNLDMGGNTIKQIGGLQNCGDDEFVDGLGNCDLDSFASDTDNQDLQDVLSQGNSAGSYDVDMNGRNMTSTGGEICAGDQC